MTEEQKVPSWNGGFSEEGQAILGKIIHLTPMVHRAGVAAGMRQLGKTWGWKGGDVSKWHVDWMMEHVRGTPRYPVTWRGVMLTTAEDYFEVKVFESRGVWQSKPLVHLKNQSRRGGARTITKALKAAVTKAGVAGLSIHV